MEVTAQEGGPRSGGAGPGPRAWLERSAGVLLPTVTLVAIFTAWEVWVRVREVPLYLLPAPSQAARAMVTEADFIVPNAVVTIQEVVIGFGISVVIGLALAVAIVSSNFMRRAVYPLIVASQVVPKIAVAPLLLVWMGFGMAPKIVIVVLIAFFPVVINAVLGLRSIRIELLYLAASTGAGRLRTFRMIRLPNALPSIFSGLKLAIIFSVIGAIVGEFVGADAGLGRVLLIASGNFDTVLLFAAVGYLTAIGIIFFVLVEALERVAIPWHVSNRQGSGALVSV